MASTAGRSTPLKKNKQEEKSLPEKNKMGREIEEIFRANKKKKKDSTRIAVEISTKVNAKTEGKKVNKRIMSKEAKETKEKKNILHFDESSENRSKRKKTAEGFSIYMEEELGIGNPDAGFRLLEEK